MIRCNLCGWMFHTRIGLVIHQKHRLKNWERMNITQELNTWKQRANDENGKAIWFPLESGSNQGKLLTENPKCCISVYIFMKINKINQYKHIWYDPQGEWWGSSIKRIHFIYSKIFSENDGAYQLKEFISNMVRSQWECWG